MSEELFMLINDIDSDELLCGHDHSQPPARCVTTITYDPEWDKNMGDEAFVDISAYM